MALAHRMLGLATERLFAHLSLDDAWLKQVRQAQQFGPVVYVLRNVSLLDYLAIQFLTKRHGLPPLGFVNELPEAFWPGTAQEHRSNKLDALRATIAAGRAAVIFLKRRPGRLAPTLRGRDEGAALLKCLMDLQRNGRVRSAEGSNPERGAQPPSIHMIPQTFVWTQRPERRGFSVVDSLFGPVDFPGGIRQASQFVLNYKNGRLCGGEALSLAQFLSKHQDLDDGVMARRLTYALLGKVERQRRIIVGPAHKAPDRVREEVLRSPKLQRLIRELAGPGADQQREMTAQAREMLAQLQMVPDVDAARNLELMVGQVLERVYAGIDVDEEGIERLRQAASLGSVVLLPSHKSHVDYLVLSYILRQRSIQLPVIAAGDNLSFFPAGPILRRAGAFFIRRSFRGDKLYTAVVDAYIRRLLREGWLIEFFLEGGRSRTGKLLPPMLGLLNMVVSAALQLPRRKVFFFPVSIGYERLMEDGAFARELSGGAKEAESAGQLLRLGGLLSGRFGRINIQFGRGFELGALRAELGIEHEAGTLRPAKRRAVVKRLAHQVMHQINAVTAATPGAVVSLALLSHGKRGMSFQDLEQQCHRLTHRVRKAGARVSASLWAPGGQGMNTAGIREVLRIYLAGGLVLQHVPGDTLTGRQGRRQHLHFGADVIFTVPVEKRLSLDITKNHILHFFVARALVAVALLRQQVAVGGDAVEEPGLRDAVQSLSRLFKFEFMFRADAPFESIYDELIQGMVADGDLCLIDGMVKPGDGGDGLDGAAWLAFFASSVWNFLEAYRVVARSLYQLCKGPMKRKELLQHALRCGEKMFLQGSIERSEAVCRPVFDNAISSFVEQGYLCKKGAQIELAGSFASEAGVRVVEARIAAYIPAQGKPLS